MLELEAALERILSLMPPPKLEGVDLARAHRRILAERIVSLVDLPAFDNSAMDGYAVHSAELKGASAKSPVALNLIGRIAAGETHGGVLPPGACVRVFTGSALPRGADAVVMQEDTRMDKVRLGLVDFLDTVKPWENIRFRGEDLKMGALLGEPGQQLTVGRLSLMAATGRTQLLAGAQPIAGLLATGSELTEGGRPLTAGKIYESNRITLANLVTEGGAIPKMYPLVADTLADTRAAMEAAFAECDVVVTSGGVSVGELDFVKKAFAEMGGEMEFWKVAVRPGRPFAFGRRDGKFLFGLPGNPVSAFVTFLLLVRPALLRWQGAGEVGLPVVSGVLAEALPNHGFRRHFMRVVMEPSGKVRSAGTQASHMLSSLAEANGLVDVPPESTLPAGANVRVLRWE